MGNYVKNIKEINEIFEQDLKKTKALETKINNNLDDSIRNFNNKNSNANKYNVTKAIHDNMQYLRNAALAFLILIGLALTSCKKDFNEPIPDTKTPTDNREMITQELRLSNFDIKDYSKGFDINTFLWNWNPQSYNLIFSNPTRPSDSKTMTATISQMKAGLAVELFRGTYNINFISTHSLLNYSQVDGKIAMNSVIVQGSPIDMTGNYDDFMIVVELPNVDQVIFQGTGMPTFTKVGTGENTYFYTFSNSSDWLGKGTIAISVKYTLAYKTLSGKEDFLIDYYDGTTHITGTNGHCYHYISALGAVTNLTFPQWIEDRVVVN